jgi:hypothetical protein
MRHRCVRFKAATIDPHCLTPLGDGERDPPQRAF